LLPKPSSYRDKKLDPVRNSSIARAHGLPSRIAHTTSVWPPLMAPGADIVDAEVRESTELAATIHLDASSTAAISTLRDRLGPQNPMAKSTRSARNVKQLCRISCIPNRPSAFFAQSTRTHSSAVKRPSSPIARFVNTAQSRLQPSSCEDEVRSFIGQSGQVSALFSRSGGLGRISSWVIEADPCRTEGPMQSDPASPPPMTTTCL